MNEHARTRNNSRCFREILCPKSFPNSSLEQNEQPTSRDTAGQSSNGDSFAGILQSGDWRRRHDDEFPCLWCCRKPGGQQESGTTGLGSAHPGRQKLSGITLQFELDLLGNVPAIYRSLVGDSRDRNPPGRTIGTDAQDKSRWDCLIAISHAAIQGFGTGHRLGNAALASHVLYQSLYAASERRAALQRNQWPLGF